MFREFGDVEIEKQEFHSFKNAILIHNVTIDNISEEISFTKKGSKYFNSYQNNVKVTPLCVFLPKISRYLKMIHAFFS